MGGCRAFFSIDTFAKVRWWRAGRPCLNRLPKTVVSSSSSSIALLLALPLTADNSLVEKIPGTSAACLSESSYLL